MSTKISLKHRYENGIGGYHLYRECLEEDDAYVYLEVDGVPFKAANTAYIDGDEGLSSIAFRLPIAWARELGPVENPPEVIPEKIIRRSPLLSMIEETDGKDDQTIPRDLLENPPVPNDKLKGAIRALMDTLCRESMTRAERAWLREHRPKSAEHWNLLTDLTVEQLEPVVL
jgi:hypothetical protein